MKNAIKTIIGQNCLPPPKIITYLAAMFFGAAAWGTDFVWTGNTQYAEDWFDNDNWTVGGVVPDEGVYPGAADTATFDIDATLNVNSDINIGTLIINANLMHRRDKWLKVAALEGDGKLLLANRGRLEFTNSATMDVTLPIDLSNSDGGQYLYIRTTGSGEVNLKGALTGNAEVSVEGSLKLYGDNSAFTGTAKIHGASFVEFRASEAGSANATWIYDGNNKKTSRINLDGDIYFGVFQQTNYGAVDFRVNLGETTKCANLVIGNDDTETESIIMGSWANAYNGGTRPDSYSKITKVGSSTLKVYCPWHRLGTEIRSGMLEVIGPDALTGRNTADISPILFTGGTLKYGTDKTTDSANPAPVTTDWSALVKGSTEFISVDTDGHDVAWASTAFYGNNADAKGFEKKGEGTLALTGLDSSVTFPFFTQSSKTNYIYGGTLEIINERNGNTRDFTAKMLGTGTLKLVDSSTDNSGFRLRGNGAFSEFEGTVDWAKVKDLNNKAYGFMLNNGNIDMSNMRFRVTSNPEESCVIMKGEVGSGKTVTVGAFDHLFPNAKVAMDKGSWKLDILGTKGDSYLNGIFDMNAVTITKTGPGKLTIGPDFAAPAGSTINVNEGVFAMDAGMTAENLPSYLTIASGVKFTGSGVFGAVDLSVNDVVPPAITSETDKTTEFTLLTATSITGTSAAMTAFLAEVNAGDTKGKWKLVKVANGDGTVTLKCVYSKNAFVIILR